LCWALGVGSLPLVYIWRKRDQLRAARTEQLVTSQPPTPIRSIAWAGRAEVGEDSSGSAPSRRSPSRRRKPQPRQLTCQRPQGFWRLKSMRRGVRLFSGLSNCPQRQPGVWSPNTFHVAQLAFVSAGMCSASRPPVRETRPTGRPR
jgi:hypothetical protein